MLVKTKFRFLFIVFILAAIIFTTCDSPMGMGQPIDFIPPVLTLDPKPPTPMYVGMGTQLRGTVTDNDTVARVILRDSTTGKQLFVATLLPGNLWQIDLAFSPEQNGETVLADVVAFDRAGNSGAESIASIVLIIDIRPPIVDDIWIQRSADRNADVEPYNDLKFLERTDPNAEVKENVERYQNGAFNIKAKISEPETRIESIVLKFYDSEYPDTELVSLETESGSSYYNPSWYVTENMLLDAGNSKLPVANYKNDYLNNNKRYYYRLRVVAKDKGDNESGVVDEGQGRERIEDQGYICLWNRADFPKGILDPKAVGGGTDLTLTKGSQLPIDFFDDDKVEWAYAAFFTKDQWAGKKPIGSGQSLTTAFNDDQKAKELQDKLRASTAIYNWRYDMKSSDISEPVVNLIASLVNDKTHIIQTGNESTDYGEFVLITLVKDNKQSPHISTEFLDVVKYRKYNITLVDENAPLIVFDKINGSPEENTFPQLDSAGNFKIHGYTLREDRDKTALTPGVQQVKVDKFRLAWIPFGINNSYGGPEDNIKPVKEALEKGDGFPDDVQWWDLSTSVSGNFEYETIGGYAFRNQKFSKTFNVLGGSDIDKPAYKNFMYNGNLENTTKIFVFYAEDTMGHIVYTQFYLVGNKTPPTIEVFDITDRLTINYKENDPDSPPSVDEYSKTGEITPEYKAKRTAFNNKIYPALKSVSTDTSVLEKTENYKVYPRGAIVKLWTTASTLGDIKIKSMKLEDMTYELKPNETAYPEIGFYDQANQTLGYVEYFPDVAQRKFRITAIDALGNQAQIQRTIAIASAATLTSITTTKQNGTYPAGEVIELRANFDGLIKLQSNADGTRPKLNVLYKVNGNVTPQQIECQPVTATAGTLYLTFNFTVPVNAGGRLITIYQDMPSSSADPEYNPTSFDRPITISAGNNILDARPDGGTAYTPGNVTGFVWNSNKNSLQDPTNGKVINLDGVAPVISAIGITDTKVPYSTGPNIYYFKAGESFSFEITVNKPIKISGGTSLRYRIERNTTTTVGGGGYTEYNETAFEYRKITSSSGVYKIVFTLDVNKTNIPQDGRLRDISLYNGSNITDDPGNPLTVSTLTPFLNTFNNNNTIYFDLTPPPKPVTTLTGNTAADPNQSTTVGTTPEQSRTTINYSSNPSIGFNNALSSDEPYLPASVIKQYSLDGGLNWVVFPNVKPEWTNLGDYNTLYIKNGQWSLKTRFIDLAGNEGATTDQEIYVNKDFPKLLAVNVKQPSATYTAGSTLDFTLDFDDVVTIPATGVTLTLSDFSSTDQIPGGLTPSYSTELTATQGSSRTVTFTWKLTANTYDMLNGIKISALSIGDLKDKFGNSGPSNPPSGTPVVTVTDSSVTINGNNATYNFSKVIVSTITPTVRSREPQNAQGRTGDITVYSIVTNDQPELVSPLTVATGSISADNKTIKLNFSKSVQKGNGTIIIRPHGNYAIPAVFEHEGYYISYTFDANGGITGETRSSTAAAGSTYVSGFYDVFNAINNTDRNTLIGGTSISAPAVSNVTGLSIGPYKQSTHGLTQGAGYTGYYGNPSAPNFNNNPPFTQPAIGSTSVVNPGNNTPGTRGTNYMVPDVETKWVLDYQYDNLFSNATTGTLATVNNIRAVLDRVEWRWQRIPVTNTNVIPNGKSVSIVLSEPLLPGLQWDVYYTEGTFTDTAGNKAAGLERGAYWFWSKGVQKPVIRVDRKSYDARAGGTNANYNGTSIGQRYAANGYNGVITDFDTISYRITSETPQARIFRGTQLGSGYTTDGSGSITAAWTSGTGSVAQALPAKNIVVSNNIKWEGPKTGIEVIGIWVRPNLIFRSHTNGSYYIMEDGINISKKISGVRSNENPFGNNDDNNRFYGFRSYNRDATITELTAVTVPNTNNETAATASVTGNFTYSSLEASKNYVVSISRIDHKHTNGTYTATDAISSARGYEGVFRTVVAINQRGLTAFNFNENNTIATNNLPMMIAGTNVRSGLPTVSGFPLKDGVHTTDSRFIKVFFRDTVTDTTNGRRFYWVTTEIVSPWYFQTVGNGSGNGSYSRSGDVEDWVTAGYGDLTYVLNLANH